MFFGTAEEQKSQRKSHSRAKAEGKRTWRLAGWSSCYTVAIKERWFEVQGRTPYDCAFYGDFEQLAYFMNVYNAMK